MSEVHISINGRTYEIGCDPGQEGHIADLAAYVDQRFQQIARAGGAYNDAHLLVLTALVLADELYEAREAPRRTGALQQQPAAQAPAVNAKDEEQIVRVINQLTKRIEGIASKVQAA